MKLAICVPLYGNVPASFFINFINRIHELLTNGRNYEIKIIIKYGQPVDRVRNQLVGMALEQESDYIMFIDSDVLLPTGAVDNLLDMNVDIASGLYFAKNKPHLPVARIKKDGKHFFLEDIEFNKIIEVDGAGLGCCLIKTKIFKEIDYPWFKFTWDSWKGKEFQLAEDLYFFDKVREKNYKIYLNTGIVCGHYGTEVEVQHFDYYKKEIERDKEDREELEKDLIEFEKVTRNELLERFTHNKKLRDEEWSKINPKNLKEIESYYINNQYEIYDHFEWHLGKRRGFDKTLLEEIKRLYPNRATEILDFGCGGGQMAYMLAKEKYIVTVADYNKKALDFISYRFKKHRLKVKIIRLPVPEIRNKFDVILVFDVLEHIPDEKFEETIKLLKSLKKPNGRIITTSSFGAQKFHPSHFDLTEKKKRLIMSLEK